MPLNLKDKLLSSYQKLKDSTTLDERVGSLLKPLQTGLQQAELARIASAREGYAPKTARLTQFQNRIESTPVLGTIASYPKSRGISAAKNIIGGLETANKGGAGNAALGGLGIGYGLMKINPFNPVGSAALSIREPALASSLQNYRQRGGVGGFLNTLNTNIKNPYTGVATTGLGMKDNLLGMAADFALDPDITPGLVNKVASRGKAIAKGFDFGRNSRSTWSPDELGMLDQINDFLRKNKTLKNFEADKIDEILTYLQRSHVPEETIQKIANQYGGNTVGYMKAMTKELQKLAKSSPTSTNYNWDLGLGITDAQPTKGDIKPIRAYHGTDAKPFTEFSDEFLGKNAAKPSSLGHWFTDDATYAGFHGDNVLKSDLYLENPKVYTRQQWDVIDKKGDFSGLRKQLEAQGHDGVQVLPSKEMVGSHEVRNAGLFAVFNPKKAKIIPDLPQPTKGDTRTLNDLQKSGLVSGFAGESNLPKRINQVGQEVIDRTKLRGEQLSKTNKQLLSEASENEVQSFQRELDRSGDVAKKVNLIDYLRTPQKVLDKIGLGKEGKLLQESYDQYRLDLNKEIDQVNQWYQQAPSPEASQRIFKWLDGKNITLPKNELKIAKDIKKYLADWADKLGLPEDKRVTNYITHIFEDQLIQKEFDPELAKLIDEKVPGSVYNPFLQERYGIEGYKEDVWGALDAYVKRATRKVNMDPALDKLKNASKDLDLETGKYVQRLASRINLRPTEVDNLLDNLIKSSPIGYRLTARPTAKVSRAIRNTIYRGALGLNVGSAVRNLTQGVNTYSKLGEKYTLVGYSKLFKNLFGGNLDELKKVGVLDDTIIQDRHFSAFKGFQQKADNVLWAMFDLAEKINRGSAYYGAKAKALAKGMSEDEAIKFAKDIVRDTQFTFGSVDTPVALSSDLVKTLAQFQSYNIKQLEFLQDMVKNKEIGGLVRYIGATLVVTGTIGKIFGYDVKDALPFSDILTGEGRFSTPLGQITENIRGVLSTDEEKRKRALKDLPKSAALLVPGGTQIKKTLEGLGAVNKGYSETSTGRVRFPVEQSLSNTIKGGLLGQYNLPEAREYFNKERSILGENQSELFKQATNKRELYDKIISSREMKNQEDEIREQVREGNQSQYAGTKLIYYNPSSEQVESIDIGRVATMPENSNLAKALKEKEVWKTTNKVMKADITPEQKQQALEALGVKPEEATYYSIATYDGDIKMAYLKDILPQIKDRNTLLKTLSMMRGEVNGERILNNDMINELYDEGIIGANEKSMLKNLKFKDGKIVNSGKGKKVKVPSLVSTSELLTAFNNYIKAKTAQPAPSRSLSDLYSKRRQRIQNLVR